MQPSAASSLGSHIATQTPANDAWWVDSIVYQIYPRSFFDSNDDGIGDLRGILAKLDYLHELGVDVLWLSPVYRSPNVDHGYDISDYRDIQRDFGTLADWRELLQAVHARGMRLIMDLVANHTSDQHPWFVEARKSRRSPLRDYYIWRPPRDGGEPNNWASYFGGSAWQYDEPTGEYYLHLFSPQQPDLNWENPAVRHQIHEIMRWWLAQGIDGFRMDVINMISKAPGLPDAPLTSSGRYQFGGRHFLHGPRLLEFLREMQREVLATRPLLTVGETPDIDTARALELCDRRSGVLSMVFPFEHLHVDRYPRGCGRGKWHCRPWQLVELKQVLTRWQTDLAEKGWNALYLSNHDQPRAVSRFGDDRRYRVQSAKMLATCMLLLQGTPYLYQGEEIGMTNVRFPSIDDYRDLDTRNFHRQAIAEDGLEPAQAMAAIHARSRDNARTPMQWDDSENAGFTRGTPWLAVNPNYPAINVQAALRDPESIVHYYRELIHLRRSNPIVVHGRYHLLLEEDPAIYAFTRTLADQIWLVLLNFTAERVDLDLAPLLAGRQPQRLLGNYPAQADATPSRQTLRPYEALVYRLLSPS